MAHIHRERKHKSEKPSSSFFSLFWPRIYDISQTFHELSMWAISVLKRIFFSKYNDSSSSTFIQPAVRTQIHLKHNQKHYKRSLSLPQSDLLLIVIFQSYNPSSSSLACSTEGTCGKRTLHQLHTLRVQGEPFLYLLENYHIPPVPRCSNLLQLFHKCLVSYYWSESCQIAHHKL